MARQENLFNCPMCGRPAEVPSRYAGKVFVHSICGSTLRMVVSPSGEVDLELVSKPKVEENFTVDLEAISKSEKGGLYEPRHLRKNLHGSADQQSPVPASFVSTKSPGEDSARLTKALVSPPEQSASRLRETRLTRDRSKSSRLQERFSRVADDMTEIDCQDAIRKHSGRRERDPARPVDEHKAAVSEKRQHRLSSQLKIHGSWKVILIVAAFILIAAVMFMLLRFLPIG